jgi:ribosomal protein S18 acetylase RimI-like enzyme
MGGHEVIVDELTVVDDEALAALRALIPQLSSSAEEFTPEEMAAVTGSPATQLLVARDEGGAIIGSLTLVVFALPTGRRAWIEDVVVDDAARGQGVATALVQAALERAARSGARTVDLTSRPEREEANRLYLRLGFEVRSTNVYRRVLETPPQRESSEA